MKYLVRHWWHFQACIKKNELKAMTFQTLSWHLNHPLNSSFSRMLKFLSLLNWAHTMVRGTCNMVTE